MTVFFRNAFWPAVSLAAASIFLILPVSPAAAMGRSEDPRDTRQPLGTEADPDIRNSDQNLQQLLFKPAASSSAPGLAPAEDRPTAAASSDRDGSRRN